MDIEFTREQKMLQDSVERMLRANYDFDKRREIVASEQGYSRVLWQKLTDLGLLGAPYPEDLGGLGGGPIATMIIMKAFGRHLVAKLASAAKAKVGEAGRYVAEQTVQLHGGMG